MQWWGILLIVLGVVLVGGLVALYFFGKKMQRKQAEAEKQMEAVKQQVSILVIDKQKKRLDEAGLPEAAMAQVPRLSRRMKVPVVKAKIGSRIMTLLADQQVFQILPVKKTCSVIVSGMYITELKSVRGGSVPKLPEKKKTLMDKLREKAANLQQRT